MIEFTTTVRDMLGGAYSGAIEKFVSHERLTVYNRHTNEFIFDITLGENSYVIKQASGIVLDTGTRLPQLAAYLESQHMLNRGFCVGQDKYAVTS